MAEIKTCEEYVLAELNDKIVENEELRGNLEDAYNRILWLENEQQRIYGILKKLIEAEDVRIKWYEDDEDMQDVYELLCKIQEDK